MAERKVTDRPSGKKVPFGYVRLEWDRVAGPGMFATPKDSDAGVWYAVTGFRCGGFTARMAYDREGWVIIRRMTTRELAKARKEKA